MELQFGMHALSECQGDHPHLGGGNAHTIRTGPYTFHLLRLRREAMIASQRLDLMATL
ncbi:hypothetical protein GGD68_002335 [Paraburkholderia fungorum]|uniref:Uncharacterized protein n=1 Tax=Paraburkholderia fungorum TaxID=134537 RepID=A0AAW3UV14_9BURK|nr:hypothetical protein [Paraburkholderia fungorum]MBB6200815.1 hypothetical protein [Paraburkholderia fungorum]